MGSKENHYKLYQNFKHDAENVDNFEGTRVEAYFLSAYHLIETCAAQERVHINKHQHVRTTLLTNTFIFKEDTDTVWTNFQQIETSSDQNSPMDSPGPHRTWIPLRHATQSSKGSV